MSPPEINIDTNPIANKLAGLNRILPPYKVAIQLNTLTAEGTAIIKVNMTKKFEMKGFTPDINIWCAQTMKDKKAMASMEYTIAL